MTLLDRYLAVAVFGGTLIATLLLAALNAFFTFVGEIGDIGQREYGIPDALLYVLFSLPRQTYEIFPMAALLGSLLGLGTLASNSELVVIRAAGVSLLRIVWSVAQAGALMVVVAVVVGEMVAPPGERAAQELRALALTDRISLKGDSGYWVRDRRQFINIREILADERISGLKIYDFDENHALTTITEARLGTFEGGVWRLDDVTTTRVSMDAVTSEQAERVEWRSELRPDLLSVVIVKPFSLAIWELRRLIGYMRDNGLNPAVYEMAFWSKVVQPFSSVVMVLLGIPFVFGSLRDTGAGQRLFVGVLLGVGFYLLNTMLGRLALVYGFHPFLAAVAPSLLFLGFGIDAIRRIR